jgi:putative thiamine transport system permease protein
MVRLAPVVAIALLIGPVLAGFIGVLLPSFGYLPALGGETLSLWPWEALFQQPGLWRSAVISLATGLITGVVALTLTFIFLAGHAGTRGFAVMRRAISPLLSVPHAAAAFGFAFLVAPSGWIARALSPWFTGWTRPPDLLIVNDPMGLTMMAGLIAKEIPFLMLMSLAALPQLGAPARLQVARTLGYGPVAAWMKVVAPALYPLIRLPVYAVVAYSSSVVDVALILGPTNPPPLAVAVMRWLNDSELSMRFVASAGAVLQLAVTLLALAIWRLGEIGLMAAAGGWLQSGRRTLADRPLQWTGAAAMATVVSASALGIAGLIVWSLAGYWRFPDLLPQSFTLANWQRSATSLTDPLLATLSIGLIATAGSIAVVLAALENETITHRPAGQWALAILYTPLVVPQIAFLFGLVIAFERLGTGPGFWPIVLGHVVFVLPYVYLSLAEAYRRLDPRWQMVAATLGASPAGMFWRVRLPLLLAPCLTAMAVGFSVSVSQYLATQLLGAGRVPTITTEAIALAAGGDRRVIGVWANVQALLPAIAFALALIVPRVLWRNRRLMRAG